MKSIGKKKYMGGLITPTSSTRLKNNFSSGLQSIPPPSHSRSRKEPSLENMVDGATVRT